MKIFDPEDSYFSEIDDETDDLKKYMQKENIQKKNKGSMLSGREFKMAGKGFETRETSKMCKKLHMPLPKKLKDYKAYDAKGILKGLSARMTKHELEINVLSNQKQMIEKESEK